MLLIVPIAFHRLSEGGCATARQHHCTRAMVGWSLVPFAVALGLDVYIALAPRLAAAPGIGAAGAAAALILWFAPGWWASRQNGSSNEEKEEEVSLKERITALLTESRVVLPGVQALLGFQLAGYLSEAYGKLPSDAQLAHTGALCLLLLAMMLLMAPAPFHRLGAHGEDTAQVEKVAAGLVMGAMAPLGLAVAADFYVVLRVVSGSQAMAGLGAAATALVLLAAWYGFPLAARLGGGRSAAMPGFDLEGRKLDA